MGGYGSGAPATVYSYTVEDCHSFNIYSVLSYVKQHNCYSGRINWSINGNPIGSIGYLVELDESPEYMRLYYTFNKTEDIDYKVYLTRTYPYFGGVRWWFECPGCGKRIGTLYSPPGSRYFLCRTCQNLTYQSCRESHRFDGLFAKIAKDNLHRGEQHCSRQGLAQIPE